MSKTSITSAHKGMRGGGQKGLHFKMVIGAFVANIQTQKAFGLLY